MVASEKGIIIDADKYGTSIMRKVLLEDKALEGFRALGELNAWKKIPFNTSCSFCEASVSDKEDESGIFKAQLTHFIDPVNILNDEWDDLNDTIVVLDNCDAVKIDERDIVDAIKNGYFVFYENKDHNSFFKTKMKE